jgi:hypothetical protein
LEEKKARNKVDCFWRMHDFVDGLATRFRRFYSCAQNIDGDEQGIPAKCYHSAIQYNGDKPYKWFFKVYSLNDAESSYMTNFYLFRGKDWDRPANGHSASSYPIIKLTDYPQYKHRNHICYVDNYFMSVGLCTTLLSRGIHCVGTLRTNRVKAKIVPKHWWYKKDSRRNPIARGAMKCKKLEDNLYCTTWFDKKPVNMMHTFPTNHEIALRNNKDKKTKLYSVLRLPRPTVIKAYNKGMGGTDQFDQKLAYYRPSIKSKKWPHRIFFHFLMCSIINAHILYCKVNTLKKHDKLADLFSFIDALVESLSKSGIDDVQLPTEEVIDHKPLKRMRKCTALEVCPRGGEGMHMPYSLPAVDPGTGKQNRVKCKAINCERKVSTFCQTCNVALCISLLEGNSTCFSKFHSICPYV